MNPVSHFQASLFNLYECHEKVEKLYYKFTNHPDSGETYYLEPSLIDISHYMILEVVGFLDEFHFYFVHTKNGRRAAPIEPEYQERVKDLHLVLKPILKAIYRWKDIEKFRDHFVAHTNRIGFTTDSLVIRGQEQYDVPKRFWELQLFRDLLHMLFGLITQEFKMELFDAHSAATGRKSITGSMKDNSTVDSELQHMIAEYQDECNQQGKEYTLNIHEVNNPMLKQMVENMVEFKHPFVYVHHLIRKDHEGVVSKIKTEIKEETRKRKEGIQ
jgi:hypothetical protein